MNARLTLEGAGRVAIPKGLREELHLQPGDELDIETAGEEITLRPVRETPPLAKEHGVWVFRTGKRLPASAVLVPVFYGDHEHHAASLSLFLQFTKDDGCCGAHTLAEI